MSHSAYRKLLIGVVAVCALLTLAHLIWAIHAYEHCSIIYFIGEELW